MINSQIGGYRLLEVIGGGGMGVVYRAHHQELDRSVAVKVLRAGDAQDRDLGKRFRREIQLAASICHPHLVKVLDGAVMGDLKYLVMEIVVGTNLAKHIERAAPFHWKLALAILARLLVGLDYLHTREIVHRDIKPSNMMIADDGTLKILDFGLSRATGSTALTADGAFVGSIPYAAPELLMGAEPTPQSDLWAAGAVLYEMLTGQVVVRAERWFRDPEACWPPRSPADLADRIPEQLNALTLGLLDWEAKNRPTTPQALQIIGELLGVEPNTAFEGPLSPADLRSLPRSRKTRSQTSDKASSDRSVVSHSAVSRWRRWRVVALCVVVAFLSSAVVQWRERRSIADSQPPAGGPSAIQQNERALFEQWRRVSPFAAALRGGGTGAKSAVLSLRRSCDIDLGPAAEDWLYWMNLGRWLHEPEEGRPPNLRSASQEPMGSLDTSMAYSYFKSHEPTDPRALASVVRTIGQFPEDGRPWLVLGAIISREGLPQLARRAFRRGLARLEGFDLETAPPFLWTACFEGMRVLGIADHPSTCRLLARLAGADDLAWVYIKDEYSPKKVQMEQIIHAGLANQRSALAAALTMGRILEDRGEPETARRIWKEALKAAPDYVPLRRRLTQHYLERGLLEEARTLLGSLGNSEEVRWRFGYLGGALRIERPPVSIQMSTGFECLLTLHRAFNALVRGSIPRSADLVAEATCPDDKSQWARSIMQLELVAAGFKAATVLSAPDSSGGTLGSNVTLCDRATGILSTRLAWPIMEQLLSLWQTQQGAVRSGLARALWLGRSGRLRESLEALSNTGGQGDPQGWEDTVRVEVMLRPLIQARLGQAASPGFLALPRNLPGPSRRNWHQLIETAQTGNRDALTTRLLEAADESPGLPFASLCVLWAADLTVDQHLRDALAWRAFTMAQYHWQGSWLVREALLRQRSTGATGSMVR